MGVQFEFTQEDLIDASQRLLARSKVVRSWRWKDLVFAALLCGMIVFLFFWKTPLKGVVLGVLVAVVYALFFPSFYKKAAENRLRKFHKEKFGAANSFICEVELTPNFLDQTDEQADDLRIAEC